MQRVVTNKEIFADAQMVGKTRLWERERERRRNLEVFFIQSFFGIGSVETIIFVKLQQKCLTKGTVSFYLLKFHFDIQPLFYVTFVTNKRAKSLKYKIIKSKTLLMKVI